MPRDSLALLLAGVLGLVSEGLDEVGAPLPDCDGCEWSWGAMGGEQSGHCYMFKEPQRGCLLNMSVLDKETDNV